MNQDNDLQRATEIDPQVTEQYKSLASETAPAHLDRAVLREATRAVRADNRKGSFGAWFRPVAFMAMVGLSLAIILDLSDTRIFEPLSDLPFEATPAVEAPQGTAADSVDRPTTQPALNEIKRQEKLAPDASRDNAAIATPQVVTGDAARTEQGQLQKMRREVVPAGAPPVAESLAEQNGASCSDEQKSAAEAWWQCIIALRQSGLQDAADTELQNLRKSFPDFTAPE